MEPTDMPGRPVGIFNPVPVRATDLISYWL